MISQLVALIKKDLLIEWRQWVSLAALILFLFGISYLIYFFSSNIHPHQWLLMYWIVFLFLGLFMSQGSFESSGLHRKYYVSQLCSPELIFASKVIYQTLSMMIFGNLLYWVFQMLLPQQQMNYGLLMPVLFLCSLGFALSMSFCSFLAQYAQSAQILMLILSIPIVFPVLGMSFTASVQIMEGKGYEAIRYSLMILIAINCFAAALLSFVIPLSWKN